MILDRVMSTHANKAEDQEQFKRSLFDYLGVDTMTVSNQATVNARQAEKMGDLDLRESPQTIKPPEELASFTASKELTDLVSDLLGEQKRLSLQTDAT